MGLKGNITRLEHIKEIAVCTEIPLLTIEQRNQNKEPIEGLTKGEIRKKVWKMGEGGVYLKYIDDAIVLQILVQHNGKYYRDDIQCDRWLRSYNQIPEIVNGSINELERNNENNN